MKRKSPLILFVLLSVLLASCGFPGIPSTSTQLPQANVSPTPTVLPPVRFPQDEAAHRDLTEWWYYTGHFNALMPDGSTHHYGFELVFFQALRSTYPPVYAAHFAISDVTGGVFHFDQRLQTEPDAALPNGTSSAGINLSIDGWSIKGVNGLDHLVASMPGYMLRVAVQGLKPPTLHNGNGILTFGIGGFSYYYSRTRMALTGTLIDHGQPLKVTGEAWMDHQWGNFILLGGGGWDWFSLQLSNNTEMMIYLLRDASGNIATTYIGYILPDGQEQLLPASALHVTVLNHWKSRVTGVNYPSGWQLDINAPHLQASLTLQPELKDQELVVYQSTGNSYWEGAVSIQGHSQGKFISGEGYVELTGYTAP
ncbi:MAG TPA: lipocalin family protein [Ktedonobacteraceae bacterium]|nr:lipocalin family protein [Ktedonobacteraceae bacterium]